jgi:hypothetical protein
MAIDAADIDSIIVMLSKEIFAYAQAVFDRFWPANCQIVGVAAEDIASSRGWSYHKRREIAHAVLAISWGFISLIFVINAADIA